MGSRLVLWFHHTFEKQWEPDGNPACVDEDYPMFHIELELVDGWAAGTIWWTFRIVECIDEELVGLHFMVEDDPRTGSRRLVYHAERAWSDGFVANATEDDGPLPYYSDGTEPGEGTPMGGRVIPKLDGMAFWVPDAVFEEIDRDLGTVVTIHEVVMVADRPGTVGIVRLESSGSGRREVPFYHDEWRHALPKPGDTGVLRDGVLWTND